jgi:hypothetical protein
MAGSICQRPAAQIAAARLVGRAVVAMRDTLPPRRDDP